MVKNIKGGSGHKSQARKFSSESSSKKTRISEDDMEVYGCITNLLGGPHCSVKCVDNQDRLCVIRGKFRGGRGKRGNMLTRGSWVLVGIREWSSECASDKESRKCDLLEVYSDLDKQELKKIRGISWDILESANISTSSSASSKYISDNDVVEFSSSTHMADYAELLKTSAGENITLKTADFAEEEEEIDVDDI